MPTSKERFFSSGPSSIVTGDEPTGLPLRNRRAPGGLSLTTTMRVPGAFSAEDGATAEPGGEGSGVTDAAGSGAAGALGSAGGAAAGAWSACGGTTWTPVGAGPEAR